uniref:Uncharacterized protein n=1 Tax=Arundo donax TaxID=35708 RepID=A0A0A9ETM9_ARUDO
MRQRWRWRKPDGGQDGYKTGGVGLHGGAGPAAATAELSA